MKKERHFVVAKTVTRWKRDNKIENWIASRADGSEWWKRVYVAYYRLADGEYHRRGRQWAEREIERQWSTLPPLAREGINRRWLLRDMLYSLHRFGTSFEEYFLYQFYGRNALGRREFDTLKLQYGYCELVNAPATRTLFEDKARCHAALAPFYKREVLGVCGEGDAQRLRQFIARHASFIYKPLTAHSGIGVRIYRDRGCDAGTLLRLVAEHGPCVVEELITQAPPMSSLHPESINTLRLFTFVTANGVEIYGGALRMGRGGSVVDNAGSGGIYAVVDTRHGIVASQARDNTGHCYTRHPDSGVTIPGFAIPDWENAVSLAREAATAIDGATMIAWDFAYTPRGWVVVEGNDVGDTYLLQAPTQTGMKHSLLRLIDTALTTRPEECTI